MEQRRAQWVTIDQTHLGDSDRRSADAISIIKKGDNILMRLSPEFSGSIVCDRQELIDALETIKHADDYTGAPFV